MTTPMLSARRTISKRATPTTEGEQRFRLSGVPWASYVAIGEALRDWPIRITYDRGELEFMTTSRPHERGKSLWGRLVDALTEELNIDVSCGGSMTFQREDLEKGFEPDNCNWIQHERQMRDKYTYDSKTDPPPDLGLEVEVSTSALDRMSIFAAVGMPEVWRWDGETVHVHLLGPDGNYVESEYSRAIPFLRVQELVRFVNMRTRLSDTAIVRAFRMWVREQQARGWPANGKKKPKPKRQRKS
jgi:Uma2 family endonuclease